MGTAPDALVAGDFNGDGRTDLAVANYGSNDVSVLLGNGDGTFQDQVPYAVGSMPDRPRGGRLQRRRPHRPGRRQLRLQRRVGACWATATAPSRPRCTYAVGARPIRHRGGRLQRRRPHRPGRRQPRLQRRVGVAGQRRRHLPEPGDLRGGAGPTPSWRATSTATAAPTWPSPTTAPTTCRCCWATATARSRTR